MRTIQKVLIIRKVIFFWFLNFLLNHIPVEKIPYYVKSFSKTQNYRAVHSPHTPNIFPLNFRSYEDEEKKLSIEYVVKPSLTQL